MPRHRRRVAIGIVISDKMDKTRRVEISGLFVHPRYGKRVRQRMICYVHDEKNATRKGDVIEIMETRPLSKTKSWRLVRFALIPQGLTREQVVRLTATLRSRTSYFSSDVRVQGSRVKGTASPGSDLDLAILVSKVRFEEIVRERFKTPNPGTAKEKTMQHAQRTGKIQAGEAGLSGLRREVAADLNLDVDLSVIRLGGPFDCGPYLHLLSC